MWVGIILLIIILIVALMAILPVYGVWTSKKDGEAQLQESLNAQKVQITQAQSRLDAAQLNKQAAIIEAEAVAKQIETIGANLKEHDLYLKWQWIKMMEERPDSSVIYVPTEASLPILEAGKRTQKNKISKEEPEETEETE